MSESRVRDDGPVILVDARIHLHSKESFMPVSMPNPLKELFKANKVALGMLVRLARSGDIARIAKTTGHDFVMVDTQHAVFSVESIAHIANVALAVGVAPVVRVRSVDDPDVQVLLDNGVTGIVYPDVNTAEEAQRGVNRAKFAPLGRRSVGGGYPIFDFRPMNTAELVPALNDNTLVACMIETPEAVRNAAEIAAVPGVDVLLFGTSDLTATMGIAGQIGHPDVRKAYEKVAAACTKHGKVMGMGGVYDEKVAPDYIRLGARFILSGSDHAFLMAGAGQRAKFLRGLG
jgi:2-keto-3-deoxy-L-rhamnonate aldolase RhmA